ncbi:hypothetical protein D9758_002416 [Tetrapyrgos nigripes]|uniref:Amino acid transporter transmembrane domain-containing protein n=1 Tax=Tetrapyrgos nigripes TaxID=182062 RepID=A0A8H5GP31_9AGAR|nr:hypothetical protein D9758_002416 [Tetrapyrgos nigripes]
MSFKDKETTVETDDRKNVVDKENEVFQEAPNHDFHYKTLSWQFVALLMIAEIVSNGMLSLPSSLAVVGMSYQPFQFRKTLIPNVFIKTHVKIALIHPTGIVPAVILIVFLGIFGLYTAKLLIDFKLNHPSVHNMGDAGFILGGPVIREILSLGTIIFAIFGTGSELLSGQQALSTLSNNGLCAIDLLLIFAGASFLLSLPRTLGNISWLGLLSVLLIFIAGIVGMAGAGASFEVKRGNEISATKESDFFHAFVAITNPVFAYAGMMSSGFAF